MKKTPSVAPNNNDYRNWFIRPTAQRVCLKSLTTSESEHERPVNQTRPIDRSQLTESMKHPKHQTLLDFQFEIVRLTSSKSTKRSNHDHSWYFCHDITSLQSDYGRLSVDRIFPTKMKWKVVDNKILSKRRVFPNKLSEHVFGCGRDNDINSVGRLNTQLTNRRWVWDEVAAMNFDVADFECDISYFDRLHSIWNDSLLDLPVNWLSVEHDRWSHVQHSICNPFLVWLSFRWGSRRSRQRDLHS